MKKINKDDEQQQQPSCDSISLTPLMKFVAGKLSARKRLVLTGVYQYSILSLLSRSEWVAAKSIQLLEEAGYDNDWLYDNSVIKGGPGLKKELVEAVSKIDLGKDRAAHHQFLLIINYIVKYFTDSEEEEPDEPYEEPEEEQPQPSQSGLGAVLNRISQPPPPAPKEEPINHWSMLADNIQSANLQSFDPIESYLSQDLLRVTSQNKETATILLTVNSRPAKDAFEVARHMVMCWVNTGYSFEQLWNMVNLANAEDILPPRDPNDNSGYFIGPAKKGGKEYLAHKFISQFKNLNKSMNSRQIDYVVWKSLLYVMRGTGKMLNNTNNFQYNVSYNYLPPGLREMEAKSKFSVKKSTVSSTSAMTVDLPAHIELSEDPMNLIIDPQGLRTVSSNKTETIPRRKYFIVSAHVEFVMFKGKPQIYELAFYCQDMSTMEVFVAPEELKNNLTTLEALGFTLNKNLNKYFYVQSGTGCVVATNLAKAGEKMSQFLEKKRLATEENQNNGLILLFKNQDCLSSFLDVLLPLSPDLTLNTVKGFGLLNSVCQIGEAQFNMVNNDVCLTANIISGTRSEEVMAKSKAELVFKSLEAGLQVFNPGYESFVQPYCFPSDGTRIRHLKSRSRQIEALYDLELFIAAELKSNQVGVFLEGIYAVDSKDLRPKADIVAFKFCQALVDVNLSLETLQSKFSSGVFNINPDLILDRMDKPQRLKVINQTRACIDFVRRFFRKQ